MPRKYRVVDHIVEHLAESGVDHIFGVDGRTRELHLPAVEGSAVGEVFADTGLHVRCYPDGGARITVGSRASTLAVLSAVSKAVA